MVQRPKYLNPFVRLPLPSVVSILHRISGAALFFALPALVYVFRQSLASPEAYGALVKISHHPCAKFCVLTVAAAFFYHACAGVRHLALDLHLGIDLKAARASSALVMIVSAALTIGTAIALW